MATNVKKTLTDAGYIAVGLGVMSVQQAQNRGRELRAHAAKTGTCVQTRTRKIAGDIARQTEAARAQAESARDQAHTQARTTVERTKEIRDGLGKRVEPVVGQVQDRLGELPERVVQAMEPVAARVRSMAGNAA